MSIKEPRFWFSGLSKSGGRTVHLISAHSIEKARASMGHFSENYIVYQLTWSDMNRLAGIAPPTVEQETTYAEGHLLYRHSGRTISIDVAD